MNSKKPPGPCYIFYGYEDVVNCVTFLNETVFLSGTLTGEFRSWNIETKTAITDPLMIHDCSIITIEIIDSLRGKFLR